MQSNSRIIRSYLVLTIICIWCVACNGQPTVQNASVRESPIITALIRSSDFSSDWQWIDEWAQTTVDESGHGHVLESASRSLWGRYSSEQYGIVLRHAIQRQDRLVPLETFNLNGSRGFPLGHQVAIDVIPVGRYRDSKCVQETEGAGPDSVICQVIVVYDCVTSGWYINAPAVLDIQTIELIINEALKGTDSRIKEIDKPSD